MNVRFEMLEQLAFTQLWQLTVVILVVGLLTRLACARRPHLAYVLWTIVLLKALTPPIWSSPTGVFSWTNPQLSPSEMALAETPVGEVLQPARDNQRLSAAPPDRNKANTSDQTGSALKAVDSQPSSVGGSTLLLILWLCGTMAFGGLLIGRWGYYAVLLRHHGVPTSESISLLFANLKQQLGLRQNIDILTTDRPFGPAVYGVWRPTLILPESLVQDSAPEHLERVMAHELIHICRGDHVLGLLQVFAQVAWWFHPLVWWANRQMCQQRERCCDEEAIASLHCDPAAYAQSLVDVLKLRKQLRPALLPVLDATEVTTKRLESIMDQRNSFKQRMPRIYWAVFLMGLLIVIPGAGITVPAAIAESAAAEATQPAKASASLQELIDQAKPGDVVTVTPGVYDTPITIEKPLTLKGSDPAKCILEVTADQPAAKIKTKGRVVIEGLTVKWQLATSSPPKEPMCAVLVTDTKATIKNSQVIALGGPKRCPSALQSMGFSDVKVEQCHFEGFEFSVNFMGGAKGSVTDCVVLKPGHCGISVFADSKLEVVRTIVAGSRFHGIRSTGGTLAVHDNLIARNENRGIYLGNRSARGYVRNNVILDNASGISGFAQSKVAINNNLLLDSSYVGLDARDSCQLTVKNNIFQGNAKGLILYTEGGRNNVRLNKNTFWNNGADIENIEKAAGSYDLEPRFRASEQGDFTVQATELTSGKQGLTDPVVFIELWKKWKNLSAEL